MQINLHKKTENHLTFSYQVVKRTLSMQKDKFQKTFKLKWKLSNTVWVLFQVKGLQTLQFHPLSSRWRHTEAEPVPPEQNSPEQNRSHLNKSTSWIVGRMIETKLSPWKQKSLFSSMCETKWVKSDAGTWILSGTVYLGWLDQLGGSWFIVTGWDANLQRVEK